MTRSEIEAEMRRNEDDRLELIGHMRKHLHMHPDEMKRCKEALFSLVDEHGHLLKQWDLAVFGEFR